MEIKPIFAFNLSEIQMTKFILIFIIILGLNQTLFAKYDINENCKNAWMLLMDLEIEQAKEFVSEMQMRKLDKELFDKKET